MHVYSIALCCIFFLMIRRPPRSTLDRSSAASDVYKRQAQGPERSDDRKRQFARPGGSRRLLDGHWRQVRIGLELADFGDDPVSYTHLRAHETVLDLVCRLLLEKKKKMKLKEIKKITEQNTKQSRTRSKQGPRNT